MASQKFSNFSIDYILGDTSGQTPPVDHPSSPPDFPGHVTRPDQLYQDGSGGHGEHVALMMNHHLSPSWAGMYSCCGPNQCHQHAPQRQRNRVRTVFADHQTHQLERLFAVTDYPTVDARAELAKSTGLTEEIVRVWFKNRRARRKRQATRPGKSAKHPQDHHHNTD
ncbi:dharma [Triplophysa rosa]|uniref:Dharma n=1 Tax=Triplophysa rosa TaxID=992332 RepID=A0A9W7TPJ5_TRIRA|nr:dharma [Triplophysa rosa]